VYSKGCGGETSQKNKKKKNSVLAFRDFGEREKKKWPSDRGNDLKLKG